MTTQEQQYKRHKKDAGKCPVCNVNLAKSREELFKKLNLDEDEVTKNGLSESDIRKAFREQALQQHPDKGGDPETFQELNEAKEELLDIINDEADPLGINTGESESLFEDESGDRVEKVQRVDTRSQSEKFEDGLRALQKLRNIKRKHPNSACPYCKKKPK